MAKVPPIDQCLTYTTIFKPNNNVYLCDRPIESKIINYEETRVLLSPYIYHIELNHGNFNWVIKRRYNHFRQLHNQIWLFYTKLTIPLPTHNSRENRKVLAKIGEIEFPKFPMLPETFVMAEGISRRIRLLEEYLQFLLSMSIFRQHPALLNFLEISPYSFIQELGYKGEEFLVKKRAGGFRSATYCTRIENFFTDMTGHWRKRWLVVKDTCLFYIRPKDKKIRYVMLFDKDFFADSGIKVTGVQYGVRIRNLSRQLVLKCLNAKKAKELADYLNEYSKLHAKDFVSANRYGSFAPNRKNIYSQWFVDGSAYFEAVSQALETAQQEIFITDWWLSPEIYLKRPSLGFDWRLDRLLLKKAEQGVRVFILLYKEMEIGISINSIYTKHTLMKMHENISVLRHPDAVRGGPLLWSHHEKLVVIDQTIAFVGGIDLCFGRWDNYEHRLTDTGGIFFKTNDDQDIMIHNSTKPTGIIYRSVSQPQLFQEPNEEEFEKSDTKKTKTELTDSNENNIEDIDEDGEDVADQVDGKESTKPKNFLKSKISNKFHSKRLQAITKFRKINKRLRKNKISDTISENMSISSLDFTREHSPDFIKQAIPRIRAETDIATDELEGAAKLWIGKDYTNFIVKDFTHLNMPFQDSIDRSTTPRMPWHDLSCVIVGTTARDVARHFIQRWNYTKFSKAKFNDRYPWLVPKSYQDMDHVEIPHYLTRTHRVRCQVTRSVSSWSIGIKKTEASIVDAYIDAITNAEHYIYIENQFFISQTKTHLDNIDFVKNRIAEAIYRRIIRAFRNNQTFRVYILIPLLPAFEGEIGTSSGSAIQQITHYNYATIVKGADSLLGKLKLEIDDPSKYIGFYSLRNYDELNGRLVTELIYVHSKLLIADDNVTIIGSSNINDRSMLGNRDSEVAVIIEDEEFDNYIMNERPYKSGKFSGSLRRMLMREHLGVYKNTNHNLNKVTDIVNDPISESFWHNIWNSTAKMNTMIYEEVFPVIPTDEIKNFDDFENYLSKPKLYKVDKTKASERLSSIKGHLVYLPLDFLIEELNPNVFYNPQDHFIPQIVWT